MVLSMLSSLQNPRNGCMGHFRITIWSTHLNNRTAVSVSEIVLGVPKKNAQRLIQCELKMTAFTRSAFIFSESSYYKLKFGIKQSKIG